jgi:hypothetical protein
MFRLQLLTGAVLLSTAPTLWAGQAPYAVPFEVGQRVEITLAKPYRTAEGVRVEVPWTRLNGKETLTLQAGGHAKELSWLTEPGRLQGQLTAVDDTWLTLDLGERRPLLRIPRVAVVRWETLGLAAQGAEPLPTGQRVRLFSKELGTLLTGHLLAIDDEMLLLKVVGRAEPIRLRRSSVEQIELCRERRSRSGRGALIGAVALGIPAAALAAAHGSDLCWMGSTSCPASDLAGVGGFVLGAAIGAPIGALIGGAFRSERWERLPLSVAVAPQQRGARAALTLRF